MLTAEQLDDVYTRACYAMTELGEAKGELFLARLALLLMKEVGDAPRVLAAIEAAKQGMARTA
jgi:Protein of unknown function (DUF2783)